MRFNCNAADSPSCNEPRNKSRLRIDSLPTICLSNQLFVKSVFLTLISCERFYSFNERECLAAALERAVNSASARELTWYSYLHEISNDFVYICKQIFLRLYKIFYFIIFILHLLSISLDAVFCFYLEFKHAILNMHAGECGAAFKYLLA